jgi:hypothetical protein
MIRDKIEKKKNNQQKKKKIAIKKIKIKLDIK